jgi:ornithine carbamoyltransferase
MTINLKNRNFLKLLDYTPAEIQYLIDLAIELKAAKKAGREKQTLVGKNIALIFEKPPPAPAAPLKWRVRPGRAGDLPRPKRLADWP